MTSKTPRNAPLRDRPGRGEADLPTFLRVPGSDYRPSKPTKIQVPSETPSPTIRRGDLLGLVCVITFLAFCLGYAAGLAHFFGPGAS